MALWYDWGGGYIRSSLCRADLGVDAYLCCPGPSLAQVDNAQLHGPGRMIFGINTSYPHIRPDVWIGLDRIACYPSALWREPFPKILRIIKNDTDHVRHCPGVHYADLEQAEPEEMFIRRDHNVRFVWAGNTFIAALHLMIWMGARRIRLVGCDFGGERDYCHDAVLTGEQREYNRRLYAQQIDTLERLQPIGEKLGIELTSCTADSPINSFLRYIPLDVALASSECCIVQGPLLHSLAAEEKAA